MSKPVNTITFAGRSLTTKEWSEATGIKQSTLKSRLGRAKDDQAKIEAALRLGASEEFILSITPKKKGRKPREAQTIQVNLTGGTVTITRHTNNSVEILDADGKALNATQTLGTINTEKKLGIELKKDDGTRRYNTRQLGKVVMDAIAS